MKFGFLVSFLCFACYVSIAQITTSAFSKVDFTCPTDKYSHLSTGDIDGDGKKDVASVNQTYGRISVFHNTSLPGAVSFSAPVNYSIGGYPTEVFLEDMDNDGKLDMISSTGINSEVVAYRNNSSGSGIAFSGKQVFTVSGYYACALGVADLDNDGKKDIVVADYSASPSYVVLRNISTTGNIMFSIGSPITFSSSYTKPTTLKLRDLDNDNKPDLVIFNESASAAVFKNTTTGSIISFSTSIVSLPASSTAHKGDIADIDGDGRVDISVSNYDNGITSVFKNTSSAGTLSFASKVDFTAVGKILNSVLRDLDGDNKPELIQTAGTSISSRVSVFKNNSTLGIINSNSFGSRVDLACNDHPNGAEVEDMDLDGKKDLVVNYWLSATLSIFKSKISPDGLIAHYLFNGNAGDSSGYENHGVPKAGVSAAMARNASAGQAYYFNGSSTAYIDVPASASLNTSNISNICVSAWFKIANGTTNNTEYSIFQFQAANNVNYVVSYETFSKKLKFYNWNVSVGNIGFSSADTVSRNEWHHVVLRIDSSNKTNLFIDNVLAGSSNIAVVKPSNPVFHIGRHPIVNNTWNFFGHIDDVKIFNRYVSNQELNDSFNSNNSKKYYSKSSGNLNQLSTWGTNTDGSGTVPLSFDSSNVTYYVRNNTNPSLGGSLKINGTNSTLVMGDGTNTFNLAIAASDTLSCDSVYLNTGITLTVTGDVITSKLGAGNSATVQYINTVSAQRMASGVYTNLVVSGSTKTLSGNTSVTGNLLMIASISTLAHSFTLGNPASTGVLTRNSGTINGALTRWFANATNAGPSGLFPVGTSLRYAPFEVEFTSASSGGAVTAEFIASDPGNNGLPLPDFVNGAVFIDKAAPNGYWKITTPISNGTATLKATANAFGGINVYQDLRLIRRETNGPWNTAGNHAGNTGNNSSVVVSRSNITTLAGEYGIGADQSANPLPVKLLTFDGKSNGTHVQLTWSASSELNNKRFDVERSLDNKTFIKAGEVKGNGTISTISTYAYHDEIASLKAQQAKTIFYRLKQIDFNGEFEYSRTISISLDQTQQPVLTIYPNPANTIIFIEGFKGDAVIYDVTGNKVFTADGAQPVNIEHLSNGVYFIHYGTQVRKLVKQ